MEPAVLAAHDEVVGDDDGGTVPVVVPEAGVDRPAVDAPQLDGLRSVEGDHPEVVVTRARVDQWVAVGIDGDRTLRDVAGRERRDDLLAGCRVDEVDPVVVGAEHDPRATSRSNTTGWPVQPVPHQTRVSPYSLDSPHIARPGYCHRVVGADGIGPVPWNERVGLPRNVSSP